MDQELKAEIQDALRPSITNYADEHEAAADYWDEQADFHEAMGDQDRADSLRAVNAYGREHVIAPLRKEAEK